MTERRAAVSMSSGADDLADGSREPGDRETSGVRVSPDASETADLIIPPAAPVPAHDASSLGSSLGPSSLGPSSLGPSSLELEPDARAPRRSLPGGGALVSDLSSESEPPPAELLAPGTLIADRFRIGRMIGRGGHGFVYEAEHVVLGYPVAIKVLCAAYGHDARRRARFRREALLGARLRHRNVVSIHDAGELEDGSPFLVMEHVDGDDLSTVISRVRSLDPAATVEIGVQLLAAVTALYERGVIHRDIKPNNVMLQRSVDGYVEVKLLDFGISKAMRAELALKTLTADDCVLGTPQYMSPEQVKGEALDVRADLYSVGALLYECLTGTPPFDAETPGAVLAKILTEVAPPVRELRPDVPEALALLVDRAVAKLPDDRWRNPAEMAEALRAVAQRLHLPRGADAWASLASSPAAPLDTMAIGLVRPRTSSRPPAARAPELARTETAAESPASKSGRLPQVEAEADPREATARIVLRRLGSLRAPALARRGRWLALAAALPLVLGVSAATWTWTGESSHASAAPAAPRHAAGKALANDPVPVAAAPASAAELAPAAEAAPVAEGAIGLEERAPATREEPNVLRPIGLGRPERDPRRAPDAAELERRALSSFLAGRDAEAVSLYARATQIAPLRASAWRGLGLAAAARDRRTATRALRRYLELAPDAPDRGSIEQRLARM